MERTPKAFGVAHLVLVRPILRSLFAVAMTGYAAVPPRIVVSAHPRAKDPLDVRFAEVQFEHLDIQDAILRIAKEVTKVYGSRYAFSPAFESATDPMMQHPLRKASVSFRGRDVSARAVFDELCRQADWSYRWTVKHDIMFRDGPAAR
jgi:hypothetical protein